MPWYEHELIPKRKPSLSNSRLLPGIARKRGVKAGQWTQSQKKVLVTTFCVWEIFWAVVVGLARPGPGSGTVVASTLHSSHQSSARLRRRWSCRCCPRSRWKQKVKPAFVSETLTPASLLSSESVALVRGERQCESLQMLVLHISCFKTLLLWRF